MAWLDGIRTKITDLHVWGFKKNGDDFSFWLTPTVTVVQDWNSQHCGILMISATAPDNFPSWDDIELDESEVKIKGSSETYSLMIMTFKFLDRVGIRIQAGQTFSIPLVFPYPLFRVP